MSVVEVNKENKRFVIVCTNCREKHKYGDFALFFRRGRQGD